MRVEQAEPRYSLKLKTLVPPLRPRILFLSLSSLCLFWCLETLLDFVRILIIHLCSSFSKSVCALPFQARDLILHGLAFPQPAFLTRLTILGCLRILVSVPPVGSVCTHAGGRQVEALAGLGGRAAGSLPPVAAAGPSCPSLAPCASRLRTTFLLSPAWRRQWPEKLEDAEFHH